MRLLVISDVHLEFGLFVFPEPMPEFDVAVFAGLCTDRSMPHSTGWCSSGKLGRSRGREIVYVAGNHEFYKSEMKASLVAGSELADKVGIHLLHRRTVVIGQVRFIGCTLWTDYRLLGTPKPSMVFAGQELNDHRLIRYREEAVTTAALCHGMPRRNIGSTSHSSAASSRSRMTERLWW